MMDVVLKRFETPDELRTFFKGRVELVRNGALTIAHATHEPGWRCSVDVADALGQTSCQVEHTGMVVSGSCTAAMDSGVIHVMKPVDLFYIARGHDLWVVGDEPYVSLHLEGAEAHAVKSN